MIQEDSVNVDEFVKTVQSSEQKEAQQNTNQKGFEFPDCVGIGEGAIVRFINGLHATAMDPGTPGSGRAKLFNIGWVRDDAGKPFLLTLPAVIKNKPMYNHTMLEFIDKVLSRTWVDNPNPGPGEAKGEYKYFYAERNDYGQQTSGEMTLKDIFWNVFKSGVTPSNQFYKSQKSWRGQTVYVANVIDRRDYEWHQKNKKTKLLMRNVKVTDGQVRHKEVSYFATGTPLLELANNYGFDLNYDVLIVPGKLPTDKFEMHNVSILKDRDFWDVVKNKISDADKAKISTLKGLTDEEKTWDVIDIDKYYRFTSSTTILKHFGKTIKNFDMMVGTDFFDRFTKEAELEKAERAAKAGNKENATPAPESKPETANPAPSTTPNVNVEGPVNFNTMSPSGVPADVTPSPTAQADIDAFYDDLS